MEAKILELVDKYIVYPKETVKELISSSSRVEYATAATGYLEGYYCPRRIELYVSGCKRGRLIKKPGEYFDGFTYYFSADNEISLIDTYCSQELLIRDGDYVYGIYYEKFQDQESEYFGLNYITVAHYKDKLIRSYSEYIVARCDIWKEMNPKDNMRIYTDSEEYLYSDEAVPTIEKIISKHVDYNCIDRIDKVISSNEYDVARINNSEKKTKVKTDNQKSLCKKLEKKIDQDMSLDEAIQAFFDVVAEAKPNDEEMLLYEVGCYSVDSDSKACMFCLVRQTPSPDGEFYQMHLELQYDICDEVRSLSECEWHEKGDDDLQEYVKNSEAYKVLKDKPIKKISVWVDET